jgi:nucleotide-binding universal stress UspA family protein
MKVQLKSIICATDLSDISNPAVYYGIHLAREFSAKFFLCHVIHIPVGVIYGEAISDPLAQEQRLIDYAHERLSRLIGEQPVDWEPLVTTGHVADEITRMATEKKVDLAICSTHGRSGLKRLVLGSVTERLMHTLPCPLLVVHALEHGLHPSADQKVRLQRILVACDFSPDSDLAFEYGLSLAQEFQSEMHLAHVIEPPVYKDLLKPAKEERTERSQPALREQLNQKLMDMVPEDARHWCTPITVLMAGQPHEELTKYAVVHDIDLIVLGVRGHGLIESLFVGSTTDRVIRQAPCPVLSVRPKIQRL